MRSASARRRLGAVALGLPIVLGLPILCAGARAAGQTPSSPPPSPTPHPPAALPPLRDGQRDFDFLIGKWKYHLKRLVDPLTGSKRWIEFDGTGECRPIWNGNAQLDTLEVDGPTGHIQGLTLRLYNPQSRQWNLNWVNSADGTIGVPTIGSFKDGRGEFYDQESFRGRTILVRYVWTGTTSGTPHFEQSFSDDGAKTWEVNWITDQVRADR